MATNYLGNRYQEKVWGYGRANEEQANIASFYSTFAILYFDYICLFFNYELGPLTNKQSP